MLAAALVLGAAPANAPAAPVLGVNVSGIPTEAQISEAIATGAKDVRMFVLWRDMEPRQKGTLDTYAIGVYGGIVKRLAGAGIHTTFVVTQSPQWASGSTNPNMPPRSLPDFGDFVGRFAGSADLKGHGVAYEIWNEMDVSQWWGPAPDPAAYVSLFKGAVTAIKAADPSAFVLLGPTTGNNYGWLQQLYDNGIKGTFDAAAVHTDTGCLVAGPSFVYREGGRIGRFSFLGYREMRKTMLDNGDDKPIWMSEFGWSSTQSDTAHPMCERGASAGQKASGVTAAEQATYLTQAHHCVAADPYVTVMDWFTARDATAAETSNFDELQHYGLLSSGGARKPSWAAFNEIATKGDPLTAPCGDFGGPEIKILTPQVGESYSDTLLIRAQANDPGGIGRISFYADGKLIRNFTAENNKPVEIDWQGAKELSLGAHKIGVAALDKQGNQSDASVDVRKVSPGSLLAVGPAVYSGFGGKGAAGARVRCRRGRVCTVRGRLRTPAGKPLPGKVEVRWQRGQRRKGSTKAAVQDPAQAPQARGQAVRLHAAAAQERALAGRRLLRAAQAAEALGLAVRVLRRQVAPGRRWLLMSRPAAQSSMSVAIRRSRVSSRLAEMTHQVATRR